MRSLTFKFKHHSAIKNMTELGHKVDEDEEDQSKSGGINQIHFHSKMSKMVMRQQKEKEDDKSPYNIFMNPLVNPRCKIFKQKQRDHNYVDYQIQHSRKYSEIATSEEHTKKTPLQDDVSIKKTSETGGQKNKDECQKNQKKNLEKLQKRNEKNLIPNFQGLTNIAKKILSQPQRSHQKSEISNMKNKVQKLSRGERSQKLTKKQFIQKGSEEIKVVSKEKIKLKMSRKHIYHTLKHKSDFLNKVRSRTHHHSLKKYDNPQEEERCQSPAQNNLRLHYTPTKQTFKNIPFKQFKTSTNFYSTHQPLKIVSKQAQLEDSLVSQQSHIYKQRIKREFRNTIKSTMQNNFISRKQSRSKKNSEVFKDDNSQMKSKMMKTGFDMNTIEQSSLMTDLVDLSPWFSQEVQ